MTLASCNAQRYETRWGNIKWPLTSQLGMQCWCFVTWLTRQVHCSRWDITRLCFHTNYTEQSLSCCDYMLPKVSFCSVAFWATDISLMMIHILFKTCVIFNAWYYKLTVVWCWCHSACNCDRWWCHFVSNGVRWWCPFVCYSCDTLQYNLRLHSNISLL